MVVTGLPPLPEPAPSALCALPVLGICQRLELIVRLLQLRCRLVELLLIGLNLGLQLRDLCVLVLERLIV
jgi:hypothetical protein